MDGVDEFLRHYRLKLLAYLDGTAPSSSNELGPLDFVQHVLDEWSQISPACKLEVPSPQERTFWFALYQLEELLENPVRGELEPYEGVLMRNLAQVTELLRNWRELPDGFYATRPEEEGAL